MPIGYGGKTYHNVYLNGTYWKVGYFNNRRVLAIPDYNHWFLFRKSGPKIYWQFNSTYNMVYDVKPQIVENTLSGEIG